MSGETRRILRWEIPLDDEDHEFVVDGPVLRVEGCQDLRLVEFWTHNGGRLRAFRVFGTGQPVPDGYVWRGTTGRTPHGLVWHLFERLPDGVLEVPGPLTAEQARAVREAVGGNVKVEIRMADGDEGQMLAAIRRAIRRRGGGDVEAALGAARPRCSCGGPEGIDHGPAFCGGRASEATDGRDGHPGRGPQMSYDDPATRIGYLDAQRVEDLLAKALAAKGENYVDPIALHQRHAEALYAEGGHVQLPAGTCAYFDRETQAPACIVGHVLAEAGLRYEDLDRHHNAGAAFSQLVRSLGLQGEIEALSRLERAQIRQDEGWTWGDAVRGHRT